MKRNASRKLFASVVGVVAGMTAGAFGPATARADTLLSQNFDSLPLGPFTSPTESGGNGQDWTATPPAGWTQDNSQVPAGNPVEFRGFTFVNKNSWIATEGNQDRAGFTKGIASVMVADSDAFDDGTTIEPDRYNPKITTPHINLAGIVPNSVKLNFDSSFRPYNGQKASVGVSFNGGAFQNILQFDTANSGGDSSLLRVDEAVTLDILNPPGATDVQFRFGMADAGNDWWWAIDNVQVTGTAVPEPGSAAALLGLGLAALASRRKR